MAAAQRSAKKTIAFTSQLNQVIAGPSARTLPPHVSALTARYVGLKGNATARAFAKAALPSIRYHNPEIPLKVEPKPAKDQIESRTRTPGILIQLHDPSTRTAFFPLTSTKLPTDKMIGKFWETISDVEILKTLPAAEEEPTLVNTGTPAPKEEALEGTGEPVEMGSAATLPGSQPV